jgi:DNA-binding beta-propeller fold protein YncE
VGDIPTKIVKDAQNNLWVLCKGQSPDFITNITPAKLVRINTATNAIDKSFILVTAGSSSIYNMNLAIGDNGRKLYYSLANNIYELDINASALSTLPIITKENLYGLAASIYNNQIWVLQAPNFTSSGYVFRYTASGSLIDSLKVGIGPNGAYFNN